MDQNMSPKSSNPNDPRRNTSNELDMEMSLCHVFTSGPEGQQSMIGGNIVNNFDDFDGSLMMGPTGGRSMRSGLTKKEISSNSFNNYDPKESMRMWQHLPISADDDVSSLYDEYDVATGTRRNTPKSESRRQCSTPSSQMSKGPRVDSLRAKNRIAAKKCRDRKKREQEDLEQLVPELKKHNTSLMQELNEKRRETGILRTLIEAHRSCHHPECQEYFATQSQAASIAFMGHAIQSNPYIQTFERNFRYVQDLGNHNLVQANNVDTPFLQQQSSMPNSPVQGAQHMGSHQKVQKQGGEGAQNLGDYQMVLNDMQSGPIQEFQSIDYHQIPPNSFQCHPYPVGRCRQQSSTSAPTQVSQPQPLQSIPSSNFNVLESPIFIRKTASLSPAGSNIMMERTPSDVSNQDGQMAGEQQLPIHEQIISSAFKANARSQEPLQSLTDEDTMSQGLEMDIEEFNQFYYGQIQI